jgi:O-antigen ligase
MTVATLPVLTDQQLGYYYPEAVDESQDPRLKSMNMVAAALWGGGVLGAVVSVVAGQTKVALGIITLVGFSDTLLRPRVCIYSLIGAILMMQMVGGLIPGAATGAKVVGMWVVILSIPRLLRSVDVKRIDPAFKWIAGFVILGVITFPLSPNPFYSLLNSFTLLQVYMLPAVVGVWLTCRRYRSTAIIVLVGFGVILAVQQIRVGSPDVTETYRRVEAATFTAGAEVDVNEMARLMSIGVFSTIYLFLSQKGMMKKALWAFLGLVLCVAVVVSKSRACYVGIPAAVIMGILLASRAKITKRLTAVFSAMLLTVVVFFVGSQFGFMGIGTKERFESIYKTGTKAGLRDVYWRAYVLTSARRAFIPYGLSGVRFSESANRMGTTGHVAHNDVIEILGDLGLPGLVLFLGMHVHLFRRIRRMQVPWDQMLAWMFWIFLLVGGLSQTDYIRKYYGLTVALLLVFIRLDEKYRRVEHARQGYSYSLACQQAQWAAAQSESSGDDQLAGPTGDTSTEDTIER